MSWTIRILLALAVGSAIFYIVHSYNTALEEAVEYKNQNERLNNQLKDANANVERLQLKYDKLDAVLAEKQGYEEAIRRNFARFDQKLSELKRADPETRKWADTPLPQPVIDLLRRKNNEAGTGLPPSPISSSKDTNANSGTK